MSAYVSTVKPYRGLGMEGAVARWYAGITRNSLDRFKGLARRVAAQVPPGSKVLEVAPGPGYFALELAKLGDYAITGLDISKTFVEIAAKNASEAGLRVDFRQGNASNMPFLNDTFDFLVCSAAFKNFTEPKLALEEMYRVLKPGGRALIVDLRGDASEDSISQAITNMNISAVNGFITKLTFRFMLMKRAYTRASFQELVSETEFGEAQIDESLLALEVLLTKKLPAPAFLYF
jgi:ubiquinone/menaquinone biosynthesis C-methylase UbiE